MFAKVHTPNSLRFKHWSRKSYAAFHSIGRHVTIGCLKNIVADTFLGKHKNSISLISEEEQQANEPAEEDSRPPEELQLLLVGLLPVVTKRISYYKEYVKLLIYPYNLWPIALLLWATFILNPKHKQYK